MARDRRQERVLALDLRSGRAGFVVLEGPDKLLDWGVKGFVPQDGPLEVTVCRRIVSLLGLHQPSVMVLRIPSKRLARRNGRIKVIVKTLGREAKRRSVSLQFLCRQRVKKFFIGRGVTTKHGIASLLAERFPDLAWKLPPKRKPWQSESYGMTIFDAAAAGVAHFGRA
jgi:hypothetical protein